MSPFGSSSRTAKLLTRWKNHVSFDFGSRFTRVALDGKVVWHQPTLLAWHTKDEVVVAVGDEAYQLSGKTPSAIELVSPVQVGVMADIPSMSMYVETVLRTINTKHAFRGVLPLSCTVAVPAGCSPVEKEQIQRMLRQENFMHVELVSKPLAVAHFLDSQQLFPVGVLDIGAQTTEVGLFVGREPVAMTTIRGIGGDKVTEAISSRVKQEFGCHISWTTAEKVKHSIVTMQSITPDNAQVTVVRGTDIHSGTMRTIKLSAVSFTEPLQEICSSLLTELHLFFDQAPVDSLAHAFEQGIYLTGGSAQLRGLESVLAEQLQALVVTAKQPELDVIKGLTI